MFAFSGLKAMISLEAATAIAIAAKVFMSIGRVDGAPKVSDALVQSRAGIKLVSCLMLIMLALSGAV